LSPLVPDAVQAPALVLEGLACWAATLAAGAALPSGPRG